MSSKPVYEPLTKLQCCPTSDGGAAAVVCSEAFVKKHGLEGQVQSQPSHTSSPELGV